MPSVRMILLLAVGVILASPLHAVTVKIKKSYPDGINENPPGSKIVEVNSPLYISDAFDQFGYSTNVVTSMSQVIIEDSSTYVIADDIAAGKPYKNPGPILLGFGQSIDPGFGVATAGGMHMYAATGQAPTIDFSNLATDSWGGQCLFQIYQSTRKQPFKFTGIRFVNTSNYVGDGMGYTEALIRFSPNGGRVPVFEDCIFDMNYPVISINSWDGASPNRVNQDYPMFKRCGFRMTETYGGAYSRRNLVIGTGVPMLEGNMRLENCTFIGNGNQDTTTATLPTDIENNWSVFWGQATEESGYDFQRCIFYNMGFGVRYRGATVFQDNIIWPNLAGTNTGTGVIVADPQLIDPENSFAVAPGSPADHGGGYGNFGADTLTPAELCAFGTE